MKLTLRRDTANRIVARLLLDAFSLERNHRTPVMGEKFTARPVSIEREIARLRRAEAEAALRRCLQISPRLRPFGVRLSAGSVDARKVETEMETSSPIDTRLEL
jgi:hypothetical protein